VRVGILGSSVVLALGLGCGQAKKSPAGRAGPFRAVTDSVLPQPDVGPVQILAADFDSDGQVDTLELYQSDNKELSSRDVVVRRIRAQVVMHAGRRECLTVLDEDWSLEGKVAACLVTGEAGPQFAVGVLETDEKFWYQWNGHAFEVVRAPGTGFE
jgi:hypothetical protein